MRKLAHDTIGAQKVALLGEIYRDFNPGDSVMTCDGLPGHVSAVLDGPFPQTEIYEVQLDRGLGGGQYSSSQLRRIALPRAASLDDEMMGVGPPSDDLDPVEAVGMHMANVDYPELSQILTERLPNENIRVFAALADEPNPGQPVDEATSAMDVNNSRALHDEKRENAEERAQGNPAIEEIDPPDACSFCGSPEFDEFTNTGRGTRARCAQCGGTMTSWGGQWQPEPPNAPENAASRQGDPRATINDPAAVHSSLTPASFADQVLARYDLLSTGDPALAAIAANPQADAVAALLGIKHAGDGQFRLFDPQERERFFAERRASRPDYDPDFGFMMRATWADVRRKAKAIKDSGGVRIIAANHSGVVGEVQGEHHLYESSFNYVLGRRAIADWSCGCKWAAYAWGRSPAYKRFEGRQCSHVTALQYEAQSRGMFGQKVVEDGQRLPGQHQRSPVTVQYDRGNDTNLNRRTVPPGNMKRTFSALGALTFTQHFPDHPEVTSHGDTRSDVSNILHAHDEQGNHVGDIHYSLEPHHDEPGGWIRHDIETMGGHEHRAPELMRGLEDHLREQGLRDGLWTHDDEGADEAYHLLQGQSHYGSLDLAPVHAFTREMISSNNDPDAILTMLASHHVDADQAFQIMVWAAQAEGTRPNDGGGNMGDGQDIPGLADRDQTDKKLHDKRHRYHHTNDAREHAPEPGWGIGWAFGPLITCDQCNGSGCGHCGGTGQVLKDNSSVDGPAVGDMSTTSSPVAGENADSGDMVGGGGMSATGALQQHEWLLQRYADYTSADFMPGPATDYQAPTPHAVSPNPGSTGWATSSDPPNWERPLIGNDFASFSNTAKVEGEPSFDGPTVSGVALKAADTGRVLMIQRSNKDEADPARGTWEFPGGHHEEGDQTSLHAGIREWEEEVGQPFPEGGHVSHTWRSGPYQGHVVVIPSESQVAFHEGRSTVNPDDPDADEHEQSAWWEIQHAKKNPALRSELKKDAPWSGIEKAAAFLTLDDVRAIARAEEVRTGKTSEQLLREHLAEQERHFAAYGRECPTCSGTGEVGDGHECARCDGSGYLTPREAALHNESEAALPSTDGTADEDDPPPATTQDAKSNIGAVPGGMYLSTQPDIPWGYSQPPPVPIPAQDVEPGSAGQDQAVGDATNGLFRSESSAAEIIAAFQATAGARALQVDGNSGEMTARQAAMAGSTPRSAPSDADIAAAARAVLAKTATKDFDFHEQQELINEGLGGERARNFGDLQIEGTHYAALGENAADDEEFMLL